MSVSGYHSNFHSPLLLMDDVDVEQRKSDNVSFWRDIVIPKWNILSKSSVVRLFWEREGIPAAVRGQVWHCAIGNDLNVPIKGFETMYSVKPDEREQYALYLEQKENAQKQAVQSIFGNDDAENGMELPFCEGLKRKKSIERDIARMFGTDSFADIIGNGHQNSGKC